MTIEKEFFNQILPLANSPGVVAQIAVPTNATGGVIDLGLAFGPTGFGQGHFFTLKPDNLPSGAAVHVAASPNPTLLINPAAVGTPGALHPTGLGWPIYQGQEVRGRLPPGGPERVPTAPGYPGGYAPTLTNYRYIHHRVNTQAGGTGMILHVMRSSLIPTQNAGDMDGFAAPWRY